MSNTDWSKDSHERCDVVEEVVIEDLGDTVDYPHIVRLVDSWVTSVQLDLGWSFWASYLCLKKSANFGL